MGQPAAKQGDMIKAQDIHTVLVPSPAGETPTPQVLNFNGILNGGLSSNVFISKRPAATLGSMADNSPPHIPLPPGTRFQIPPTNKGVIQQGSATVKINGKPAARNNDMAMTCTEGAPNGKVVVVGGTVNIGG